MIAGFGVCISIFKIPGNREMRLKPFRELIKTDIFLEIYRTPGCLIDKLLLDHGPVSVHIDLQDPSTF